MSQDFVETKTAEFFSISLTEDILVDETRDPIMVNIAGRVDNIFSLSEIYTANIISGLEKEDDNSARYTVIGIDVDPDRTQYVNLKLRRKLSSLSSRYEDISIYNLIPSKELLEIKAGEELIFSTKIAR
jgi:hypothetical protein